VGIDLIKEFIHVGLGERDHPIFWVGGGPHTWHDVAIVKASMKFIEFVW
jgi:hypothetical protein